MCRRNEHKLRDAFQTIRDNPAYYLLMLRENCVACRRERGVDLLKSDLTHLVPASSRHTSGVVPYYRSKRER